VGEDLIKINLNLNLTLKILNRCIPHVEESEKDWKWEPIKLDKEDLDLICPELRHQNKQGLPVKRVKCP